MICPGVNFTECFAWGSRRATAETKTASAWVLDKLALWVLWPERSYSPSLSLCFSFLVGAKWGWIQLPAENRWATWGGRIWNGCWSTDRTFRQKCRVGWRVLGGKAEAGWERALKSVSGVADWGQGWRGGRRGGTHWKWGWRSRLSRDCGLMVRSLCDQANDHKMFNCIRWCLSGCNHCTLRRLRLESQNIKSQRGASQSPHI